MTETDLPHCPRLLARALQPLPPLPLGLALTALSRRLSARHSGMLRRLGEYADRAVLIDPTDLPFVLRMEPAAGPRITAHRRGRAPQAAARIAGPLSALTGMLHGRYDGDALFFSRDLVIEGDTSVVLALRNALDDAELDLAEELAALAGPLGPLVRRGVTLAERASGLSLHREDLTNGAF
ncbi:ubiquinone anaerobic biosynthesis accessory factor UbiT [Paracoccus chinensis]|uniref:Predicted lipid carrier protein YhbT, contains SCP2 domain n=1 Tax=Paracoccus chinensis TaxID=525640 RepID=A0A1G9MDR0_9RHOB|nr:SCP2 sterol-binding domain-containing protein [Paracoccus chinensis]SDL72410.1 Predicted lipid carrier protein YhbT, contains SCP2 domain [Paracoccus chinensis]